MAQLPPLSHLAIASQFTLDALAGVAAIPSGTLITTPARATLAAPRRTRDCLRCLPRMEAIALSPTAPADGAHADGFVARRSVFVPVRQLTLARGLVPRHPLDRVRRSAAWVVRSCCDWSGPAATSDRT